MYVIPNSVKIGFCWRKSVPGLSNRVYRIIWCSISIGHIRDQYFLDHVSKAVRLIKKHNPKEFKDFMQIIYKSGLGCFGNKTRRSKSDFLFYRPPIREPDLKWWRQVWNLISQNGDIELIETAK